MSPPVGSSDGLHNGCAQSIATQPGRVNGEHFAIELDNRADTDLLSQQVRQIVAIGANEQTDCVIQFHQPAVFGDLGFVLDLDGDPVRQLGRPNRSDVLLRNAWHEESQALDNISGVKNTVMLLQPVVHHSRPSSHELRPSFGTRESTAASVRDKGSK
ncbi:hypothetical protein [Arthrobacter sp. ISL-28]|uniref:hypothetical protein n=1 Tax=Arthrobacter sp. ISL-28 TaxID=2819108 RepID=UPI001BE958D8|nr:hypothetical protein [Arthrobacter sp. ISL-28]MBT2521278.1 hypothetical protein [Arthrobacter sp. ISL-28]